MQVNKSGVKKSPQTPQMYAFVSQSELKKKTKFISEGAFGKSFLRLDAAVAKNHLLLLPVHWRFWLMRRRRVIGRLLALLALPLLRRRRCCLSGLRQRAEDAHRLSV